MKNEENIQTVFFGGKILAARRHLGICERIRGCNYGVQKMKIVGIKTEKGEWLTPAFWEVFRQSGPNTVEIYSRRLIKGHGWSYRIKKVEKNCEIFYQEGK